MKISVFTEIKAILIYEEKKFLFFLFFLLYIIMAEYGLMIIANSHSAQNKQSRWWHNANHQRVIFHIEVLGRCRVKLGVVVINLFF